MGYAETTEGLLDADTNMTYAVKYLAGAYRAAGGNHDQAIRYYQRGYYYEAKSRGFSPYERPRATQVAQAKADKTDETQNRAGHESPAQAQTAQAQTAQAQKAEAPMTAKKVRLVAVPPSVKTEPQFVGLTETAQPAARTPLPPPRSERRSVARTEEAAAPQRMEVASASSVPEPKQRYASAVAAAEPQKPTRPLPPPPKADQQRVSAPVAAAPRPAETVAPQPKRFDVASASPAPQPKPQLAGVAAVIEPVKRTGTSIAPVDAEHGVSRAASSSHGGATESGSGRGSRHSQAPRGCPSIGRFEVASAAPAPEPKPIVATVAVAEPPKPTVANVAVAEPPKPTAVAVAPQPPKVERPAAPATVATAPKQPEVAPAAQSKAEPKQPKPAAVAAVTEPPKPAPVAVSKQPESAAVSPNPEPEQPKPVAVAVATEPPVQAPLASASPDQPIEPEPTGSRWSGSASGALRPVRNFFAAVEREFKTTRRTSRSSRNSSQWGAVISGSGSSTTWRTTRTRRSTRTAKTPSLPALLKKITNSGSKKRASKQRAQEPAS